MKNENKVADYLSLNEMNNLLKDYRNAYEIYRHPSLIRMSYKRQTVSKAQDNLNMSIN